jgi:membrane protein implicated in regulation of membrane protease activity
MVMMMVLAVMSMAMMMVMVMVLWFPAGAAQFAGAGGSARAQIFRWGQSIAVLIVAGVVVLVSSTSRRPRGRSRRCTALAGSHALGGGPGPIARKSDVHGVLSFSSTLFFIAGLLIERFGSMVRPVAFRMKISETSGVAHPCVRAVIISTLDSTLVGRLATADAQDNLGLLA